MPFSAARYNVELSICEPDIKKVPVSDRLLKAVLVIRLFLGLLDPDPLVRGTDLDPDPFLINVLSGLK
jgi:hypothetical protein